MQHETRAMLDGQIHDIGKVADTIRSVSDQLEQLTGKKLNNVCIAAAGRVLKTVEQEAEVTFTTETVVTTEHVYSLDMLAVERHMRHCGSLITVDSNIIVSVTRSCVIIRMIIRLRIWRGINALKYVQS